MARINIKERSVKRWNALAPWLRGTPHAARPLRELAAQSGLAWYHTRGEETLGAFLDVSGNDVLALPGFGAVKLQRLCEIAEGLQPADVSSPIEPEVEMSPRDNLAEWGVPENFPIDLLPFSIRILHFCEREGITNLLDLLAEGDRLGSSGFKAIPNVGKGSARELEAFFNSLRRGDRGAAARWLPLALDSAGLNLASALMIVANRLKGTERKMLRPRLVEKRTLEECAEINGVTRERVRQVEAGFLANMERRLQWFGAERAEMLSRWVMCHDEFAALACDPDGDSTDLIEGALDALFRDTPQGVARELAAESAVEEAVTRLETDSDFWFGGASLEAFAAAHLPAALRHAFAERISASPRFRIDHAGGRVHPRRAGLLRAVTAMVADEDEPIPLTWLVRLLRETRHFPEIERIDVVRRRGSWRARDPDLDARILWRQ